MILRGKAALPVRRPGAGSAAATVETAPEVVDVAHDASAKKDFYGLGWMTGTT
ncbi:hypothetical protein VTK73DRAFT_5923 [Phialemonium thermophilum]|uniref:Uncharacterized protein n=1 Tax=Phialemonium thermophilum TaxID=223376 RepID=A0ABR3V097_9PEZI